MLVEVIFEQVGTSVEADANRMTSGTAGAAAAGGAAGADAGAGAAGGGAAASACSWACTTGPSSLSSTGSRAFLFLRGSSSTNSNLADPSLEPPDGCPARLADALVCMGRSGAMLVVRPVRVVTILPRESKSQGIRKSLSACMNVSESVCCCDSLKIPPICLDRLFEFQSLCLCMHDGA